MAPRPNDRGRRRSGQARAGADSDSDDDDNNSNNKGRSERQHHRRSHDEDGQEQQRELQQQRQLADDIDDMEAAHVDANRLLVELRAAISGNMDNPSEPELPPLPNDNDDDLDDDLDSFLRSDASFLDRTDAELDRLRSDAGHTTVDERELRRHLMDVESSFIPDVGGERGTEGLAGATGEESNVGADDTYVNMNAGSPGDDAAVSRLLGISNDNSAGRTPGAALRGSHAAVGHDGYDDAGHDHDHDHNHDHNHDHDHDHEHDLDYSEDMSFADSGAQSVSEVQPSSPAAAAAQRTHHRTTSENEPTHYQEEEEDDYRDHRESYGRDDHGREHRATPSPPRVSYTLPQPQDVGLPPSEMGSFLTPNSVHSHSPGRLPRRPSYFSARQVSSRSYAESILSPGELNADYALQTGGAIPADADQPFHSHHSGRSGYGLSRLPSFGSIASAVSRDNDDEKPVFNRGISGTSMLASLRSDRQLSRLEEEDKSSVASDPMTPRPPTTSTFAEPTDTVIAQHIQNIQVPETIAREYHRRNRDMSPDKRPQSSSNISTTFQGRPRSGNLTLKEQNSKIDKLTKENFDLKLKIHFLDQALQNRSDEGVKDMINKNVQFQTDLANERKENQGLRKRIRELERRNKEQSEELHDAQRNAEEDEAGSRQELEWEITQLSEEVDRCQVKITRLSADNMAKEIEKRKMAEYITALNDRKGTEQSVAEEESEMWKDLLTTETARREQAEDDIRKLREEIVIIRSEKAVETSSKSFGFNRLRRQRNFAARSASRDSEDTSNDQNERGGATTASSITMVEQLKHENAELRRDLGAQTSMLTSRNKERERLQQEIEDLKLQTRKGDGGRSVAGDSILDRSISRQNQRATSRASGQTGNTPMSDNERDEWERRDGQLRDQNAALRMNLQDLEREMNSRNIYIDDLEQAVESLETNYDSAVQDLQALQKERDDALQALDDREREATRLRSEYEKLKDEAVTAINELEGDLDVKEEEAKRFASDLKDRNDDFNALQRELRDLNNALMQLEDDRAAALKRIESLEQELDETTRELEDLDKKLRETTQKNERLEVQHESLHSEISFLREEQEGDKIKIGDLENSLNAAQQSLQDEREKMQELEESLIEERRQREIVDNQSKQEVQKVLNDLNTENSKTKDEARRLRRALSTKEVEASSYKKSLEELENSLRKSLGDLKGKRTSWIPEIERLQTDLNATMDALEKTKGDLSERDRLLRHRDALLESSGLESRRLSDLLDKERDARKRDHHQFEQMQRGHSVNNRTMAQNESRMLELESARSQDRRKMAQLEQQYRDQLIDRNNLLLALWNRLSTLCGTEWAQNHSLVNGELPSVDVIARSLPSFNKNIIEAVRTIEAILGSFKQRIRGVERTLWKDYQTLSNNLDGRVKRMDFLERAVKDAQAQIEEQAREQAHLRSQQNSSRGNAKYTEEIAKMKQELKVLKAELKFYKQNPSSSARLTPQPPNQQSNSDAARRGSATSMLTPKAIANTLMRHHSSTTIEQLQSQSANPASASAKPIIIATPPIQPSEQRWIHRLKELERRLKAEREARLLDRRGARQRLEERSLENEELKAMLEREKDRRGSVTDIDEAERGSDGRGRGRAREGSVD